MRFSNEAKNFFMNVKILPDELEDIVYSYIPKSITILKNIILLENL
jgi:hypothetical protein